MDNEVDILLVEDNPNDAELAIRAFKKSNLAGEVIRVSDGEEALDFITGFFSTSIRILKTLKDDK
jgi:two-component system, response regulator